MHATYACFLYFISIYASPILTLQVFVSSYLTEANFKTFFKKRNSGLSPIIQKERRFSRYNKPIASFLVGRQLSIKVGQSWSSKRRINGGSPQGCISANALFCATIECLQEGDLENSQHTIYKAALFANSEDSTMYVGDSILNDIPSCEDTGECVPFALNRDDAGPVDLWHDKGEHWSFIPRIVSSPIRSRGIHFSSHVTEDFSQELQLYQSNPRVA